MRRNNIHKIFAGLLAAVIVMCAAIAGKAILEKGSEKAEAEPLVINTVEQRNDGLLTVIRDSGETVFQYEGTFDVWLGADGKTYAVIYLDEGVQQ